MGPELEKVMFELGLRMRLLRAAQEEAVSPENLTERDTLILELLNDQGEMTVSQIAATTPNISDSTISTNITKLWRQKLVSKTISPENQRVTMVKLTDKGKKAIDIVNEQRLERFQMFFKAIQVTGEEKEVILRVFGRAVEFFDKYLKLTKTDQT
jgi:DNA-binding MarR family transcriptional regulator